MATASPSFQHHRPLLLQSVVLILLVILHGLTHLDHWLLALLGAGLLLAVELLALPLPLQGAVRWIRQLGWLAAVLLVTGVCFHIYYLPYATTLQQLGMATLLFYSWIWGLQRFPSTQKRYYPALLVGWSFTSFLGLVYAYMHVEETLTVWAITAASGSFGGLLLITMLHRRVGFPKEFWWRLPQLLHILFLMLAFLGRFIQLTP